MHLKPSYKLINLKNSFYDSLIHDHMRSYMQSTFVALLQKRNAFYIDYSTKYKVDITVSIHKKVTLVYLYKAHLETYKNAYKT